jgi:hypothetical protein
VRPAPAAPLPYPAGSSARAGVGIGGSSSFDKTPADLSPAVLAADASALSAVVAPARDDAGTTPFDPSFSPD